MKIILIPFVMLMFPVALLVVAFNVALAFVEDKIVEAKLKEKNNQ